MKRTQIQLPDELYRELKQIAAQREWSLADALRRGAEYVVRVYRFSGDSDDWHPPKPRPLGSIMLSSDELRECANPEALLDCNQAGEDS